MTVYLHAEDRDASGRAVVRLLETTRNDDETGGLFWDGFRAGDVLAHSAEAFPVEPGRFRFTTGDRASIKRSAAWTNDTPLSFRLERKAVPPAMEIEPGDVLVADHAEGRFTDDGTCIRLVGDVRRIARGATREEALATAAAAPEMQRLPGRLFWDAPQGAGEVLREADEHRSHGQPDRALVLAWVSDGDRPQLETAVLSASGTYMWWALQDGRSCEDCSITRPREAGLWIMEGGDSWTSTDWETQIVDGWGFNFQDMRQVSPGEAALAFGMTEEGLLAEIAGVYPYDLPEGVAVMDAVGYPPPDAVEPDPVP
jgi:hypothetical protein